ncbi:MAG: glycosyltransferase family 4 protein [Actinomycetota bacterium]|nr:glycosyltransferase family 4 protein [Actinomycetota bacterium]
MKIAVEMISAGSGFGRAAGAMVVYYSGLLQRLVDVPSVDECLLLVTPWNDGLAIPDHPRARPVTCTRLPRGRVGRIAYEQTVLPTLALRHGAEVLLSTCNIKPEAWRRPSVVVLQSLQYLHFPASFGRVRSTYLGQAVRRSVTTADVVIAVSEWERVQAIRHFGLDGSRVVAVHHGVSDDIAGMVASGAVPLRPAVAGDDPYLLMVSTLYGFKNHHRLIGAFAEVVRRHGVPHRLLIVGGDADVTRADLAAHADRLGVGDRVVLTGALPHHDVPALVAHADAVVYPSLYETFGMPVLEALAFGRPLVTSDHGPMAELARGAAELVRAEDTGSIAAGVAAVLLNPRRREALMAAGPDRASMFTWEACAAKTAGALELAVETHGQGARSPWARAVGS